MESLFPDHNFVMIMVWLIFMLFWERRSNLRAVRDDRLVVAKHVCKKLTESGYSSLGLALGLEIAGLRFIDELRNDPPPPPSAKSGGDIPIEGGANA